jgi:cob(I)alamin adenosyltransferase
VSGPQWSHSIVEEPDGTLRVDVTDEEGAVLPVARQITRAQAERLIQRISAEAESTNRPIKAVIRDPYFMAATVITVKRLPD